MSPKNLIGAFYLNPMPDELHNLLLSIDNLLNGAAAEESAGFDPYLYDEETKRIDNNNEFVLPDIIGILPIRNAVAFPGTVTPLAIGRKRSKALLADTEPNESIIGLLTQRDSETDTPNFDNLYSVGTAASVLKITKLPHGPVHILVHGIARFRIVEKITTKPYLKAKIQPLSTKVKMTKKLRALIVSVRQTANRVIALSPNVPEDASVLLENIEDPSALADFLAANLNVEIGEKQQLLEELDAAKRLERISYILANQLDVLELSHKIQGRVRESVEKSQREYFLQEQLKVIQSELGQKDLRTEELKQIGQNIAAATMPKKVEQEALRELDRLSKIPPASPEYSVIRTYLDWVCELPWSIQTQDRLDINKAQRVLNTDHYDLRKVKQRILEFLAVRKLNPTGKSPILCFVGPPGVGKTSLGKSIARAMGRKFVRISLGGIRDEADIRGHRRTYIGALPGRILQELRKCRSRNPVFMLDELDKIGSDFRGDPASALLEVLDPEQNVSFSDHYLDQPFDLSGVMFIGTANYMEPVPPALKDRMEIIELPGYTETEKLNIAKKYLIPRQIKEHGLSKKICTIKDETILAINRGFTREAGVRNLERNIAAICRAVATEIAKGNKRRATITKKDTVTILGPVQFESELALRTGIPGVATALAYTPVGGELLFIESASMPGKGQLQLTGQIGDVMKESAQTAFSLVKANATKLNIESERFSKFDYHIHVPAGAIPKDGPSAGVAMFTSLVSLLLGKPTRPDIAMTGEITLRGLVLPIGGLKEKILAAKQAGIKTVILPARNKKDLPEIPKEAQKDLTFEFVKNTDDALKIILDTH
ncbi:MAG: endopeptidase La [Sedimentisphaerales bacterium]|nr:endopeptidase La [Sedimentisphaerales bacterium]